jgi:prophage DNA circulation protein
MSWRDQLLPASFRGVPFFVERADSEEGRRGVLHDYPQRDEGYVEDLGRASGEYSLDAIIIGPDYFTARDALRDALKQSGPGELVHPTLGRLTVGMTSTARFTEDLTREGGLARFSLRFTETYDNTQPAAEINTQATTEAEAVDAEAAVTDEFDREFTVAGQPQLVRDDATVILSDAVSALDAAGPSALFVDVVPGVALTLDALVTAPAVLAGQVFEMCAALRDAFEWPIDAVAALNPLTVWQSSDPREAARTPSRIVAAANRAHIEALIRRTALIESARAVAAIDFDAIGVGGTRITYQQAADLRESLADALDAEATDAQPDVWGALMALRAAVVRDITARGADLPRRVSVTMPATLPALVVAYRATGDATREREIVAHNNVRHPGFVPGGKTLWVVV